MTTLRLQIAGCDATLIEIHDLLAECGVDRSRRLPSNQAMQLTASERAVYASGVCRRHRMLRFMHSGSPQLIFWLVRS